MKRTSLLFHFLLLCFLASNYSLKAQTSSWTQKANFGGSSRVLTTSFTIGTKAYVGLGKDSLNANKQDFWEWDQSTNTWTQKANFGGTARNSAIGFAIGTKGYIGTGWDNTSARKDFWEWDQSTNTWTQKTDFGGTERTGASGFSIGTKGYIGFGIDSLGLCRDLWEWDQSGNTWTQKANLPGSSRQGAVAFSISTKGYVGTGADSVNNFKKDFWEWNQTSNTWTQKTDFIGNARANASGFVIGSYIYLGLGFDSQKLYSDFYFWDQANNVWKGLESFPSVKAAGSTAFSVGTKGYVKSGSDGLNYSVDLWEFVPPGITTSAVTVTYDCNNSASVSVPFTITGTFNSGNIFTAQLSDGNGNFTNPTNIGTLTSTSAGTISATLSSGIGTGPGYRIRVISSNPSSIGTDNGGPFAFQGAWTSKANFGGTSRLGAVSFSIGSKGYIGTGYDGAYKKDFWEYDPSTNAWTQKADFGGTARDYAVGFSIGTKGYIGTGNDGANKNDFWQYDPSTNAWTSKTSFPGAVRQAAVGFSIGTKGYLGTGSGVSNYQDFYEYDPTGNSWTRKADFAGTGRGFAVGFSVGMKGYIGTGQTTGSSYNNDFWEYDQARNVWQQKPNYPGAACYSPVGFSIGTRGYIGTGTPSAGTYSNTFYEYNPATNNWVAAQSFPISIYAGTAFSIDTKGYVGTGIGSGGVTNSFYSYNSCDPVIITGAISPTTLCAGSIISVTFTALGNFSSNNVFVIQLSDETGNFTNSTEIGTIASSTASTINVLLPTGLRSGSSYRIRVVAISPGTKIIYGSDNGSNLSIVANCGSLVFDGVDDRVVIPNNSAYNITTGDFTIEAWVKMDPSQGTNPTIISSRISTTGYSFFVNGGTKLSFISSSFQVNSSTFTSIYDNVCHHVAVSRSSGVITFFLDGVAKGTASSNSSLSSSAATWIGNDQVTSAPFKGSIDDVRFWNVSKTATDISTNKSLVLPGNTTGLKGVWDMNESSGQVVYDGSLTQNNGSLGSNSTSADSQDPTRTIGSKCFTPSLETGLVFDGVDDRAVIPHIGAYDFLLKDFTMEAWINLSSTNTGNKEIISNRTASSYTNAFMFMVYNSGTQLLLQVDGWNLISSSFTSIFDNTCHHIAATRSGTSFVLYLDGVSVGTFTATKSISAANPMYLGYDAFDNAFVKGNINELRLWNVARSSTDINNWKSSILNRNTNSLVGYWKFNEPSDETIYDVSYINNNGYLGTNSTLFDAQNPTRTTTACYSSGGDRKGVITYLLNDTASSIHDRDILIYPNPFNSSTNIVVRSAEEKSTINVFDLKGTLIFTQEIFNNKEYSIGEDFQAGLYYVQVITNQKVISNYKIVKIN